MSSPVFLSEATEEHPALRISHQCQKRASPRFSTQREPVMIRRHNRDVAVLLLPQEYDRLGAVNPDEFQRFCDRIGERVAARGMTEEKLAAILVDEG